ncbi:MAG: von willebrand factor type a [Flavipsychrobacter sp.]|jgi:hypothetical protein|nr:von willebrand factor type a [Flavipsychrobacter sp.]
MRLSLLIFGLLLLVRTDFAFGQVQEIKQPRILIVLDGSSSMLQPWQQDQNRFKTAARIITTLMDSLYKVNNQVEFALRVYGHQHPAQENNCFDTRREVMFSRDNFTQMSLRLAALQSLGVSPIAFSLKEAAEYDLVEQWKYNYSLVLITDGGESCGGNICDIVKTLLERKIHFKPYIVSLVDYAPLRDQYACLGSYLLTAKENDIPVTVSTIVESYRPMLLLKTPVQKIEQASAPSQAIPKAEVPKVVIKTPVEEAPRPKETVTFLNTTKVARISGVDRVIPPPRYAKVDKLSVSRALPDPVDKPVVVAPPAAPPAPVIVPTRQKEQVVYLNAGRIATIKLPEQTIAKPQYARVDKLTVPPLTPEPEEKPVVVAAPPPPPKPAPVVKLTPKPTPKPTPPPQPADVPATKPKEPKFAIEREEQKETTLEVYFTDGKGKFYQTTPQIVLLDPKTNSPVQKFFRTVNIAGNPQPQKLPEGVYNLTVAGKSNLLIRNVDVKLNNKNKILIQVGKASLRFEYEDDPNQPVKEYSARVKKNFEPGPLFTQLCTQELEYDPGNYHIEISTQPRDHRSVDLDFDALVVIKVEKPGFVQINNTNNVGKVTLYYELGDQFVQFYKLDVNGDLSKQHLRLQRGHYKVGYNRTPNVPYAQETLKEFTVKTNQTTQILLD